VGGGGEGGDLRPLKPPLSPALSPALSPPLRAPLQRRGWAHPRGWSALCFDFPSPWGFEACLEAVSLGQPKILARQHSYKLFQVQPCWGLNTSKVFRVPLCPCANTFCVRGMVSAKPRRASKRLDCRRWKHGTFFINKTERERLSWSRQAGTRG